MNINQEIIKLKKKIETLDLKTNKLDKSIKDIKKSGVKNDKRKSERRLSLIDRLEADERLKSLMMPD